MWREVRQSRKQLKAVERALSEVELNEERLADLDDWREEDDNVTLCANQVTGNERGRRRREGVEEILTL